ncbi:MAG: DNA polymerase II [Thermofilaceae archaeon]
MLREFWLLDASYDVVGGIPEVRLWGIDRSGERVVVLDRSFRPYIYVLPEEGSEERVAKRIAGIGGKFGVIGVEIVDKKYFGKPVKAVKVTLMSPRVVPQLREAVAKLEGVREVLEADIRFYMRYMIDKGVRPCGWHSVEVEEVPNERGWRVGKVYLAKSAPQYLGPEDPPDLRIYAIDIECYNPFGEPNADRDPIIVISVKRGGEVKVFTAEGKDDKPAIAAFIEDLQTFDPDVIVGYNSNRFDWPYLLERAKRHGLKLDVSRGGGEPTPSVYGHYSIVGRANVDLYDFAEEVYEVKVKTLDNIADYLGVKKRSERVLIEGHRIHEYWDDPSKRPLLIRYSIDDVESTYGLAEKFLPFAIQLSNIVGLPLDQVGAASVGNRVDWYLMRAAFEYGELIPNRVERPYEPYRGAIVLKPSPGVHKNVAVLDFTSMYPSLMIKYNISPDTYVPPDEVVDDSLVHVAPEVGHRFRKDPPGFYKKVLENLLEARRAIRAKMKGLNPDSPEYRLLDERQRALKVVANASYGYCGWVGARWYKREVAEATTAWGRKTITETIALARKLGLRVIYGDTDSLFVVYEPEKVETLVKAINEQLNLDIKVDKVYVKVFFTEAKKRYCGLLEDGRIDVVGLEAVRGDWAEIAKEVQERVIELILKEGDVGEAVNYVRKVIEDLRSGRVPLEKLIIWKSLGKGLDEYEVEAAHVAAARRLIESGYRVTKGGKIGFVIVSGSGRLADKAVPYIMVKSMSELDLDYYVRKQVIPAAMRVLEYFGVKENQLLETAQRTLLDFFGS